MVNFRLIPVPCKRLDLGNVLYNLILVVWSKIAHLHAQSHTFILHLDKRLLNVLTLFVGVLQVSLGLGKFLSKWLNQLSFLF